MLEVVVHSTPPRACSLYCHPGGLSVNNPAMVNDRGPLLDSPTAGCPVSAWNLLQVSSHRGATRKFRELQRRNVLTLADSTKMAVRRHQFGCSPDIFVEGDRAVSVHVFNSVTTIPRVTP